MNNNNNAVESVPQTKIGTFISKLASGATYIKNIEVYKLKENLKTPMAGSPADIANCEIGDFILIFDNQVWVKNRDEKYPDEYIRAIYSPEFVRINPAIFEKQ